MKEMLCNFSILFLTDIFTPVNRHLESPQTTSSLLLLLYLLLNFFFHLNLFYTLFVSFVSVSAPLLSLFWTRWMQPWTTLTSGRYIFLVFAVNCTKAVVSSSVECCLKVYINLTSVHRWPCIKKQTHPLKPYCMR